MPNTSSPQRLPVHPSILGVPQGWEDDPDVPLPDQDPLPEARPSRFRHRVRLPQFTKDRTSRFITGDKPSLSSTSTQDSLSIDTQYAPSVESILSQDIDLHYPAIKTTYQPPINEVLPFASSRLHSAWELADQETPANGWRRGELRHVESRYAVGWEIRALDMENRLNQAMFDLFGKHTFVDRKPKNVLDIGTGLGSWPIAQASIWDASHFVGLDIAPCQPDLGILAQHNATWKDLDWRITWQKGDFLSTLPFDTGSFDMVHMRFIGSSVPETKWLEVLEEATRVLDRGGCLEIVDMGHADASVSDAIKLALPLVQSLIPATTQPLFSQTVTHPVLSETITPASRPRNKHNPAVRIKHELRKAGFHIKGDLPEAREMPVTLTAWIATKK